MECSFNKKIRTHSQPGECRSDYSCLVRVPRFELGASWTPFKRDTKLRHTRIFFNAHRLVPVYGITSLPKMQVLFLKKRKFFQRSAGWGSGSKIHPLYAALKMISIFVNNWNIHTFLQLRHTAWNFDIVPDYFLENRGMWQGLWTKREIKMEYWWVCTTKNACIIFKDDV